MNSVGLRDTAVMRSHGGVMRCWRESFSAGAAATDSQLDDAEGRAW